MPNLDIENPVGLHQQNEEKEEIFQSTQLRDGKISNKSDFYDVPIKTSETTQNKAFRTFGPTDDSRQHQLQPFAENSCIICGLSFSNSHNLQEHFDKHKNECPECADLFEKFNVFQDHLLSHGYKIRNSQEKQKSRKLEEEGANFLDNEFELEILHKDENDKELENKHGEQKTEDTLSSETKLQDNNALAQPNTMMKTILKNSKKKENRTFSCDICGKIFARRATLHIHQAIHSKVKTFQCYHCGQSFRFNANLQAHLITHTGVRAFQCNICMKTFARSANMKEHWKIHTGEKPFRCEHCNKRFSCSASYVKHKKLHTGERPFNCVICKRSFVQLIHLKKHLLTHTGEKSFQCMICKKFYGRKDTLKKHLSLHNN